MARFGGWLNDAAARAAALCVSAGPIAVIAVGLAACSSDAEPPPMIEQIRLTEIESGPAAIGPDAVARSVFAFGTHPDAAAADVHPVTTALVTTPLRVVVNKRLAPMEELECRYVVDDDVFAPIPAGLEPDDVRRCAVAQDQLASQCAGSSPHAVCLCEKDGGCPSGSNPDGSDLITPRGESVGVQDRDQDGTSDATQLIAGRAVLTCGAFDVPIDLGHSYWSPSGSQVRPLSVTGTFDQLGPAIVITPASPLPSGQRCGLALPGVTDDAGVALCAPPDGNLALACTPGDTSAFGFTALPLGFFANPPVLITDQSRTEDVLIQATSPIDASTLANLIVVEGAATPYAKFTVALPISSVIQIKWTEGLAPHTRYAIVIPTTVTDLYHVSSPLQAQVSFTTGD